MKAIASFFGTKHVLLARGLAACGIVLLLACALAEGAFAQEQSHGEWRLRIREAAVTQGDTVLLGDIAEPFGPISERDWKALAERPLWAAPPEPGKPLQVSRARLSQVLRERLGEYADRCMLPANMAIQRGGVVWYEDDIRSLIVRSLTPLLNALPGRVDVTDFRLPAYIFLAHAGQEIQVEPIKPTPGRISFRFQVMEVDGSVSRRFTGTAFVNVWAEVPCAAKPYNKGDQISPEGVTWVSKNLAHLRGELWDGRGGPWQLNRAIGTGQPIFQADIAPKAAMRKGAIVNLLYQRGSVRVSVQAEALADGALGETIPVRNLQSKKQVFGTVQDSTTLVVK